MKIICDYPYEPCFKVYKMSENVEHKYYYGKTRQSIKLRMIQHQERKLACDIHFSNIGWNNVICQVIEACKDENEMNFLESNKYISQGKLDPKNCLNIASGMVRFWDDDEKAYIIRIDDDY